MLSFSRFAGVLYAKLGRLEEERRRGVLHIIKDYSQLISSLRPGTIIECAHAGIS